MKLQYLFLLPVIVVGLLLVLLVLHPIPEDTTHRHYMETMHPEVPQSPFMRAISITVAASMIIGFGLIVFAFSVRKTSGDASLVNTQYVWSIFIGCGLVTVSFLFNAIAQGMWPLLLFLFVIFSVSFTWSRYKRSQTGNFLQSPSPDKLINAHFRHQSWGMKEVNSDALQTHSRAYVHLLYGQYDSARRELLAINWNERIPAIQGSEKAIKSLLCYFDTKDNEEGLRLAHQTKELLRIGGPAPGKGTGEAYQDFYIELGEILCGRATPEMIQSLETKFQKFQILGRIVVAWALALAYRQTNQPEKFQEMRLFLQRTAPHCQALHLPEV